MNLTVLGDTFTNSLGYKNTLKIKYQLNNDNDPCIVKLSVEKDNAMAQLATPQFVKELCHDFLSYNQCKSVEDLAVEPKRSPARRAPETELFLRT